MLNTVVVFYLIWFYIFKGNNVRLGTVQDEDFTMALAFIFIGITFFFLHWLKLGIDVNIR